MERMKTSEKNLVEKCKKVDVILDSLTVSLHTLCIDQYSSSTSRETIELAIASSSPSTPCTTSIVKLMSYRHGDPAKAMHGALADLFGFPFASMCYVAINGRAVGYVNSYFEQLFMSGEELNAKMKMGIPPPLIFTR